MVRPVIPTQLKILIKELQEGDWLAHCLELDIVTVAPSPQEATDDILELICAQIRYAAENDNWDYLYKDAPKEVWDEYLACPETPRRLKVDVSLQEGKEAKEVTHAPVYFSVCSLKHGDVYDS